MSMDAGSSTLLLIGSLSFTVALLYRIQMLMGDSASDDREQLDRMRELHRRATQKYLEALKQLAVEDTARLSTGLAEFEEIVSMPASESEEMQP